MTFGELADYLTALTVEEVRWVACWLDNPDEDVETALDWISTEIGRVLTQLQRVYRDARPG